MDAPLVVAIGLLTSGRRVLVVRRPDDGPLPGLWQFPGGKIEFGEHPWAALRRELDEELGTRPAHATLFGIYSHVYDVEGLRAHVVLVAYAARLRRNAVRAAEERRWVTPEELRRLPFVPGSKPIVADLLRARR